MATPSYLSQPTRSIQRVTNDCITLFQDAESSSSISKPSQLALQDAHLRLRIWAGNLGLNAAGSASADYRLRDDPDIRDIFIGMLARLQKRIGGLLRQPFAEPLLEESAEADDRSSSSSSTPSIETSPPLSLDQDSTADDLNPPDSDLGEIDDIITRLYRLTAIIKKSGSQNEFGRINRYIQKHQEDISMVELQTHVRWHIETRLTRTPPHLADRLVNAAISRRWKLLYRSAHHDKLNFGTINRIIPASTVERPPGDVDVDLTWDIPQVSFDLPVATESEPQDLHKERRKMVAFSMTEASSINKLALPSYPKSVAMSAITKSAITRRDELDIPPAPDPGRAGLKETICPYCFHPLGEQIIGQERKQQMHWRRHVLRDMTPYVCLFEDCETATDQYTSVDAWSHHMHTKHAIVWSCQFHDHHNLVWNSREGLEKHLVQCHQDGMIVSQLPQLIERGAQPAGEPFAWLLQSLPEFPIGSEDSRVCPLCAESALDLGVDIPASGILSDDCLKIIRDHIASHLEVIALLSLPEADNLDDATSNNPDIQSTSSQPLDVLSMISQSTTARSQLVDLHMDGLQDLDELKRLIKPLDPSKFPTPLSHDLPADDPLELYASYNSRLLDSANQLFVDWSQIFPDYRDPGTAMDPDDFLNDPVLQRLFEQQSAVEKGPQLASILPDSSSAESLQLIKDCYDHCKRNHRACTPIENTVLPTRVLDIGDNDSSVRLLTTSGKRGKYAFLSHCWGAIPPRTTTSSNFQRFHKSISYEELPRTFRDATAVLRHVGIRYLWIDALCIVHDSMTDCEIEVPKCVEYVKNAAFTIAASHAHDCSQGLFNLRDPRNPLHFSDDPDLYPGALTSRLWIVQEHYFSTRYLSFEATELTWSCDSSDWCECSGWNPKPPMVEAPKNEIYETWRRHIVPAYSSKTCTRTSDRPLALSSIFDDFAMHLGDVCQFGLWEKDLNQGLCWYPTGLLDTQHRFKGEGIPSWSWLSIEYPVCFADLPPGITYVAAPVSVEPASALLRLHGPFLGQLSKQPMTELSRASSYTDVEHPDLELIWPFPIGNGPPLARRLFWDRGERALGSCLWAGIAAEVVRGNPSKCIHAHVHYYGLILEDLPPGLPFNLVRIGYFEMWDFGEDAEVTCHEIWKNKVLMVIE